jgi:hypothetical protein
MSNLTTYKTPLLAVLEQEKKIREYSEEERLTLSLNLVTNLLLDLGVSSKSDPEQHQRAIQFLANDCGKYTIREIDKAFKLAIQGYLNIDLFQQVNVLVIGKVLKAFDDYKIEQLRVFRQKKIKQEQSQIMTEQEKNEYIKHAILKQILFFKENGYCDENRFFVYDLFEKNGLLNLDKETKLKIKKQAIESLKKEYNTKRAKDRYENKLLKEKIKDLDKEKSDEIKIRCKVLALEYYLKKAINNKKETEKINKLFN